jgi:4-hydroxybenzoate polyprenyltransferase/phosphoserine phosphatase
VVVDLDGTLVATDTLWESLLLLLRKRPLAALAAPLWALRGRAHFKARVAAEVCPDARTLPYREAVLERIHALRASGAETWLATAANEVVANAVAGHLDCFDEVIASDAHSNRRGESKLAAVTRAAGDRPFLYVGNAVADLPLWERASEAACVAASPGARRGLSQRDIQADVWVPSERGANAWLRSLRPHQWSKNALLFAPLALAHDVTDTDALVRVAIAFVCFCAVASATYLLNDLLDLESDRVHPSNRQRPLAAGDLAIPAALATAASLAVAGFALSACLLGAATTWMLAIYLALTTAYSLWLKEKLFIDVLLLAGLYTQRVLTGAVAAPVEASTWLLAFSLFFFLGLALVKRYVELLQIREESSGRNARRAYRVSDISLIETMGLASGYVSILVLGLYVSSESVTRLYARPEALWLISPLMLFWISRMWFLARRGQLDADPVLFATTDRASYLCGLCILAIGLLASTGVASG